MMKMPNNLYKNTIWILILSGFSCLLFAQDKEKQAKPKPIITLKYFNVNNQSQYVIVQCNLKENKKLTPLKGLPVRVYIEDETIDKNLLQKMITNDEGKAFSYIPASTKDLWKISDKHKFIAVTDSIPGFGVRQAETEISVARLNLDTVKSDEGRKLMVHCEEHKDSNWIPVKDLEIKLGIKRLASQLSLGESETVTTDSTGSAVIDFTRDSLPGDIKGNLIVLAKVEDNDNYGNIIIEKQVPWGRILRAESKFGQRSLWATGTRVPLWLLSLACVIIFSVWATLVYLVMKIMKIRKLGLN